MLTSSGLVVCQVPRVHHRSVSTLNNQKRRSYTLKMLHLVRPQFVLEMNSMFEQMRREQPLPVQALWRRDARLFPLEIRGIPCRVDRHRRRRTQKRSTGAEAQRIPFGSSPPIVVEEPQCSRISIQNLTTYRITYLSCMYRHQLLKSFTFHRGHIGTIFLRSLLMSISARENSETSMDGVDALSLDDRLKRVRHEEEKWNSFVKKLQANTEGVARRVNLNVGGTRFTTTKETLLQLEDTYFSAMLANSDHFKPEDDGSYFIDRSPKYFEIILQYLRSGTICTQGMTREQMRELVSELDYYCIHLELQDANSLLSIYHEDVINGWMNRENYKIGPLLYKATRHGFTAEDFHRKCDNRGPTVTLLRSRSGYLFGGINKWMWNPKVAQKTMIFTLTNPHGIEPTFYPLKEECILPKVYKSDMGAIFGGNEKWGHDIRVSGNPQVEACTIQFPVDFVDTTGKGDKTFTGENTLRLNEVEVYSLIWMPHPAELKTVESRTPVQKIQHATTPSQ
ncbi:hypothetical protein PROFUN_07288 [Planoprotostelium fungivorum]|uniref:BTB domain-containing protein n=1 Tax=Planoprotostelium fungivorum TaxID=1890364 RepID=A0A2P6NM10_9EUKA|nr:hypothetical protein PROFUN_07288 [Planoprotostelium fungivorum]